MASLLRQSICASDIEGGQSQQQQQQLQGRRQQQQQKEEGRENRQVLRAKQTHAERGVSQQVASRAEHSALRSSSGEWHKAQHAEVECTVGQECQQQQQQSSRLHAEPPSHCSNTTLFSTRVADASCVTHLLPLAWRLHPPCRSALRIQRTRLPLPSVVSAAAMLLTVSSAPRFLPAKVRWKDCAASSGDDLLSDARHIDIDSSLSHDSLLLL